MTVSYLIILGIIVCITIGIDYAFSESDPVIPIKPDVKSIKLGSHPDGIAVNSLTNKIYVTNWGDGTISIIDGNTDKVIDTINVDSNPNEVAINPSTNLIYVLHNANNSISIIDGSTDTIVDKIILEHNLHGIAINPITNTIYVGQGQSIAAINGTDNKIIKNIFLGCEVDCHTLSTGSHDIAVNPTTNTIYVSHNTNFVASVIDGTQNILVDRIRYTPQNYIPGVGAYLGIDINPITNRIYVTGTTEAVLVVDGSDNSIIDVIQLESNHFDVAVNPTKNLVYGTLCDWNNVVSVFNASDNTILESIKGAAELNGKWSCSSKLDVNPLTNTIYVTHFQLDKVSVISPDKKQKMGTTQDYLEESTPGEESIQENSLESYDKILEKDTDIGQVLIEEGVEVGERIVQQSSEKTSGLFEGEESFSGVSELIEQIDETLGEQVSVEIDEESVQLAEDASKLVEASFQSDDESIQNLVNLLPYFGIIIAGIIGGIIVIKKRNQGKDDELSEDYDDDDQGGFEAGIKPIESKFQQLQAGSHLDTDSIEPEQIIENKLNIISILQKNKIGDNDKLEAIKKSLISNGFFTEEENNYLETKYEEYKKITKKDFDE